MKRIFALLLLLALALCALTACKSGKIDAGTEPESASEPEESAEPGPEESNSAYFLPGRITVLGYEGEVQYTGDITYADHTLTVSNNSRTTYVLKIDEAGNPVQESFYDQNGSELRTERTYENGLLMTEYIYSDNLQVSFAVYEYDENGNELMMQQTGWYASGRKSEYDKNGNCTLLILYDETGDESLRREYTYDGQGRLIREKESGRQADSFSYEYSYDEQGRLDRTTRYLFHWVELIGVHTYDEEGRLIDLTWVDSDGNALYDRHSYLYNENGDLEKDIYYSDSEHPWNETVYAYDGNGNPTEKLVWMSLQSERIVKEGRTASGYFRADITEKEYQTILSFLRANGYDLP